MNHTGISRMRKYAMGISMRRLSPRVMKIKVNSCEYRGDFSMREENDPERGMSNAKAAREMARVTISPELTTRFFSWGSEYSK